MIITATDLTTLAFILVQSAEVTERVFTVGHTVGADTQEHLVLVHIDKQQNDVDGDGTIDALDGKFCLSLINNDGTPVLINDNPIKISQVHSINVEVITPGSSEIIDWISDISTKLIPIVINKKAALEGWGMV